MKVYGLYRGDTEGGGCEYTLYTEIEVVRAQVQKLIDQEKKTLEENRAEDISNYGKITSIHKDDWQEISPDQWTDGFDWIGVQEFEVITCVEGTTVGGNPELS